MQLDGPILDKIKINYDDDVDFEVYPFSVPVIKNLSDIVFPNQVTFIVGENGTGKSTILEAIASNCGFGKEGGSKNIQFETAAARHGRKADSLASHMTCSWRKKPKDGYFFRAESFFNIANYLEEMAEHPSVGYQAYRGYGGESLHNQSHGESFLSFFKNRVSGGGFYVFDEPEAALSPQRQLALLKIMNDVCKNPESQFVIATHSPILLAYPEAHIYSCDNDIFESVEYKDTNHYDITKGFLDNPKLYLAHLFK